MSRYSRLAGRMRGPPTLAPSLALTLALALARPQYDVLPKAKGALDTVTTAASNLDANYGITSKIDEQLKLSQAIDNVSDKIDEVKSSVTSKVDDLKSKASSPS